MEDEYSNQKYAVSIELEICEDYGGDCVVETWTNESGCPHRLGDKPAIIRTRPDTGEIVSEEFFINGQRHRGGDKPAVLIKRWRDDSETLEWWKNGVCHRDESHGPAEICQDTTTGIVKYESWQSEGVSHRTHGPAHVMRDYETGVAEEEIYYFEGRVHRSDGPAHVIRDSTTGIAVVERWIQNHKTYRDNGYASIKRDAETGTETNQEHLFKCGVYLPGQTPLPEPD